MNDKLLQKKGRIVSAIAAELLGKEVHERFMPIMYYQKKFHASQGTVQNAINFLKEKGAVKLRNKGYQGSYIEAIDYDILMEYCEAKRWRVCMPLPHNTALELLAHHWKQSLQSDYISIEIDYMQTEEMQLQYLRNGTCDFMLCSKETAESGIRKYPELQIALLLCGGCIDGQIEAVLIREEREDLYRYLHEHLQMPDMGKLKEAYEKGMLKLHY